MNLTLLPRDDPPQALRIRRLLMASATYFVATLIFVFAVLQGLMEPFALAVVVPPIVLANAFFYGWLRSGLNKRCRDPSLTVPQIICATLLLVLMMYYAGHARGVLLLLYLVTFVFGVFKLTTRQFVKLVVFALVNYAGVIILLAVRQPEQLDIRVELMRWFALACALLWFSLLGGYISTLRQRLSDSRAELQKAMARIAELATRDELTGLSNRRRIMELLGAEKERVDRFGGAMAIALLDLDHFKEVNDQLGHLVGDEALRLFARVAGDQLRSVDVLGRFGGEEFLLLLPRTEMESAQACVERVRAAVAASDCSHLSPDLQLTVSAGVASYQPGESIETLLERADAALYAAKAQGRNRVHAEPAPA